MKKLSLSLSLALLMGAFLFTSCSKDGGDAGPAGPAGPAGSAGPAGTPGATGATGTANVIYSAWLDVTFKADTVHDGAAIDTIGFYVDIPAGKVDNAMLTTGEIKVYVNLNTAAQPNIAPLPYFDVYSNISISPTFSAGFISLYSNINAGTALDGGVKYQQYRYVLIPGGTAARVANPINWNNYNEVKAYLGLKD